MPFQRRSRLTLLLVIIFIIIIYIRTGEKRTRTSDFYTKTKEALDDAAGGRTGDDALDYAHERSNPGLADRVNRAKNEAKQKANAKGADFFGDRSVSAILEEGHGQREGQVDDQKVMEAGGARMSSAGYNDDGVAKVGNTGTPTAATIGWSDARKTDEEYEVDVELDYILKKSPSKSLLANFHYQEDATLLAFQISSQLAG